MKRINIPEINEMNLKKIMYSNSLIYFSKSKIFFDKVISANLDMNTLVNMLMLCCADIQEYPYLYEFLTYLTNRFGANDIFLAKLKNLSALPISMTLKNVKYCDIFLNNWDYFSSLPARTIYELLNNLPSDKLNDDIIDNIIKSIKNANFCVHHFPNRILEDPRVINKIAKLGDLAYYQDIVNTIKEDNPNLYNILEKKRYSFCERYIDAFTSEKIKTILSHDNPFKENLKEMIFDHYFKASVGDVYLAGFAINCYKEHLTNYKNYLTLPMLNLVETINKLFNLQQKKGEITAKLLKSFNKFEDNAFGYEETLLLMKLCEEAQMIPNCAEQFANLLRLARSIFEQQVYKQIDNTKKALNFEPGTIHDITDTKFTLLVHRQTIIDNQFKSMMLPIPQTKDHDINISMSLIDRNHTKTLPSTKDDPTSFYFGYDNLKGDNLLHAFPADSFTRFASYNNVISKLRTRSSITRYVPAYLDVDKFLGLTGNANGGYNELKIKATANDFNIFNEPIMRPSYLLCLDRVREQDLECAKQLNIPIYLILRDKIQETQSSTDIEDYGVVRQIFNYHSSAEFTENSIYNPR